MRSVARGTGSMQPGKQGLHRNGAAQRLLQQFVKRTRRALALRRAKLSVAGRPLQLSEHGAERGAESEAALRASALQGKDGGKRLPGLALHRKRHAAVPMGGGRLQYRRPWRLRAAGKQREEKNE